MKLFQSFSLIIGLVAGLNAVHFKGKNILISLDYNYSIIIIEVPRLKIRAYVQSLASVQASVQSLGQMNTENIKITNFLFRWFN